VGAVASRPEGKTRKNSALRVEADRTNFDRPTGLAPPVLSGEDMREAKKESEYRDFYRATVAEERLAPASMSNPMKKAGRKSRRKSKKVSRKRK
jgi:hypothetical protein